MVQDKRKETDDSLGWKLNNAWTSRNQNLLCL